MTFEESFELEHLFLNERKCRSCGKTKNLLNDFYLTRKDRGTLPSAYSYECKPCTIDRVLRNRMDNNHEVKWEYPDWQCVFAVFPHRKHTF